MEEMTAGKLLGLAAVAANSAAADLAAGGESEEEEHSCRWTRDVSGDVGMYEEGSEEEEEQDESVEGKRKRMSVDDRKARNRERNRLHARKTRQRKKQHVQELQLKIWGLRQERQRLLQLSTEHRTAGVLLALSCSPKQCVQQSVGSSSVGNSTRPRLPPTLKLPSSASTAAAAAAAAAASNARDWSREVASHEDALRKITQEFEKMDGGHHGGEEDDLAGVSTSNNGSGRPRAGSSSSTNSVGGVGGAGVKGGSRGVKGTLADRTALRRERNRMHAKRTRNRKKLFVEACSVMIDKMKVENAQLVHEIQASGIHLPQENWVEEVRETIPEEPLPEYLAALWDFAEGKSHVSKTQAPGSCTTSRGTADTSVTPPATPATAWGGAVRQSRRTSSSSASSTSCLPCAASLSPSCSSSSSCSHPSIKRFKTSASTSATSKAPPRRPSPPLSSTSVSASVSGAGLLHAGAGDAVATSTPGQALEDATTLCAFMEAAHTRSMKRSRVTPPSQIQQQQQQQQHHVVKQQQAQARGWSDHGSTTSESRGGSEFSEEDSSYERKSADGSSASSSSEASAIMSPAFWTSRQVLERYVLPRKQLPRG